MWNKIVVCLFVLSLLPAVYPLEISIEPDRALQGKTLVIKIPSEDLAEVKGEFLGQHFDFYQADNNLRGIVGIPTNQEPGFYNMLMKIKKEDGKDIVYSKKIKIVKTNFPVSKFWLKPSVQKLRAPDLVALEWGEIEKILIPESSEQRWEGLFSFPVQGEITQGFGRREIINGKSGGTHRGVDFAASIGTEVSAPNNGKVVFTKVMKVFGGTVVIDHGQGVDTLYFHLSKILVKEGENVNEGEVIGFSGNSGVSSGPHLHWAMSVHNLRVDPLQWTRQEI